MGQDYSYSQPSSSSEFDMTSLLEAEAQLYADEAESSYIAEAVQYTSQPEAEEMSQFQRQLRHLKNQGFKCEEKLGKLQKTVHGLKKTVHGLKKTVKTVCVMVSVLACIGLAVMCVTGKYISCAYGCSSSDLVKLLNLGSHVFAGRASKMSTTCPS